MINTIIVAVLIVALFSFGWLLLRLAEERDRMPYTIAALLSQKDSRGGAEADDQ